MNTPYIHPLLQHVSAHYAIIRYFLYQFNNQNIHDTTLLPNTGNTSTYLQINKTHTARIKGNEEPHKNTSVEETNLDNYYTRPKHKKGNVLCTFHFNFNNLT
jgi:hypothetical protein